MAAAVQKSATEAEVRAWAKSRNLDAHQVAGLIRQESVFEAKVKSLTIEAVNEALRKYFDKSKLVMVYSGDFEKGKTTNPTDKKGF